MSLPTLFSALFRASLVALVWAGAAVAQSGGITAETAARNAAQCFSYCGGDSCTTAYFFRSGRNPNCLLTRHSHPLAGMQGDYTAWFSLLRHEVSPADWVTYFPEEVVANPGRFSRQQVAAAQAVLDGMTATDGTASADFTTTGALQCNTGALMSGTRWLLLYRSGNYPYFQHADVICSSGGDTFFRIGNRRLERYDCRRGFTECRRSERQDIPLGPSRGGDSQGATDIWEILNPDGSGSSALVARF